MGQTGNVVFSLKGIKRVQGRFRGVGAARWGGVWMWVIFHWKTSFGNNTEELTIAEGAFVEHCGKFFNKMTLASLILSQKRTNYSWCIIYHHSFKENKTQTNKKTTTGIYIAATTSHKQLIQSNSWTHCYYFPSVTIKIIHLWSNPNTRLFGCLQPPGHPWRASSNVLLTTFRLLNFWSPVPTCIPLTMTCCFLLHLLPLFWKPPSFLGTIMGVFSVASTSCKQETTYGVQLPPQQVILWYTVSFFFSAVEKWPGVSIFSFLSCLITCPTLKCAQTKLPNTYLFELHRIQQCHRNGHWHC